MNFQLLFTGNFFSTLLIIFPTLYLGYTVSQSQPRSKGQILLAVILYSIGWSSLLSFISLVDIQQVGYITTKSMILATFLSTLCELMLLSWVFRRTSKTQLLFISTVASMIIEAVDWSMVNIASGLGVVFPNVMEHPIQHIAYHCMLLICIAGVSFLIFFILKKMTILKRLERLSNSTAYNIVGISFYYLTSIGSYYFVETYQMENISLWVAGSYSLVLILSMLLADEIIKKEQLKNSQKLLQQHTTYLKHLESVQNDLHVIQQDYQSIVQQLHHFAQQENAPAIIDCINTELLQVDNTVQNNIQQLNQLTYVELAELKGLILTKILEAQKAGIYLSLEVLEPFQAINMAIDDLLRCVGILLDNAIEATAAAAEKEFTLLLLKEGTHLSIVVKNPTAEQPNLAQLSQAGYSSKGSGRGLGLNNYQQILAGYDNIFHETRLQQHYFVQTMTIT